MRRRPRVDRNHGEVRDAFRALGYLAIDTSGVGSGFPDLLVMKDGRSQLVEVKDGSKAPSARKLTPAEELFHRACAVAGCPVIVVSRVEDVTSLR